MKQGSNNSDKIIKTSRKTKERLRNKVFSKRKDREKIQIYAPKKLSPKY